MRKRLFLLLPVCLVFILAGSLRAGDLHTKGRAWLGAHGEAAAIDVNGTWYAKEWGKVVLNQDPGGRDLTGKGDGWDITGVVAGRQIFLLFSGHDKVIYSAVLTLEGESTLNGSYAKGFMDERTKGRSMRLTKQ